MNASPSTTAAMLYDMGGTADQSAALALIMFTASSAPYSDHDAAGRARAATISADLLGAAAAGGFADEAEFRRLVDAGQLTARLLALAFEALRCTGGAAKFFELLELSTTPMELFGGAR